MLSSSLVVQTRPHGPAGPCIADPIRAKIDPSACGVPVERHVADEFVADVSLRSLFDALEAGSNRVCPPDC
jgi:hypothetical protein